MVLTDYKGLTVEEMTEMRNAFRASGVEYRVVKNTLARIATEKTPASAVKDNFTGPVGLAMGYDDAVAVAKSVLDYAKRNDKLKVTCGVVDGTFYDEGQLRKVAALPSREVLLGMLAGVMQAPPAKLARLLGATVTRFAYALDALKGKKAAG
jgi:large subunit ribosomal protein L10